MKFFIRFFQLLKNSNLFITIAVNPFSWIIKPKLYRVKSTNFADDWLLDPYVQEYRFVFLMLKISIQFDFI